MKNMMLMLSLLLAATAGMTAQVVESFSADIIDSKLKSSGSYLLVEKDKKLFFVFGVRNKPGRNEDKTLTSFHGNIIRKGKLYDTTALDAAKRNLTWEFLVLDGDYKTFPNSKVLNEEYRQKMAKNFLQGLKPVAMLKNRNWDKEQRPNFMFIVKYEEVSDFIENFDQNIENKSAISEWSIELTKLQLIEAHQVINAIEAQVKATANLEQLINYGEFTPCGDHKIYDACSRTLAASMAEIKEIAEIKAVLAQHQQDS